MKVMTDNDDYLGSNNEVQGRVAGAGSDYMGKTLGKMKTQIRTGSKKISKITRRQKDKNPDTIIKYLRVSNFAFSI